MKIVKYIPTFISAAILISEKEWFAFGVFAVISFGIFWYGHKRDNEYINHN